MKIRSRKLLEYLIATGALNQGEEAILEAKQEYRRQYKVNWKQTKGKLRKDLRISLTLRQYQSLQLVAFDSNTKPTAFARKAILATLSGETHPLNPEMLQRVLQLISMSINDGLTGRLKEAEKLLVDYLKNGRC